MFVLEIVKTALSESVFSAVKIRIVLNCESWSMIGCLKGREKVTTYWWSPDPN
jgi:hypothetical protein